MGKHFLLITLTTFFLLYSKGAAAQMPDSVRTYIDNALYIMQSNSLYGKQLDWERIRDTTYQKASGARDYKQAFPALAYAFQKLKDYHGMVANQDTFYRYPPPVNFSEVLSPGIKKEFLKGNRIVTAFLDSSVAYLRVPGMHVTQQQAMDEKANMLRDSLCMLLSKKPKAIIIDLRMNAGGNSAPMQSGIGPLFQTTLLGYSVDRDGKLVGGIRLKDGVAVDGEGKKLVTVQNSCTFSHQTPVAVLVGPSTVSSGEILAALLRQQPNVELFGEPTAGFLNATEGYFFMGKQGYLLLSVSKIADATKHVYEELRVQPNMYIKNEDNYDDLPSDPTVIEALNWVRRVKKK